MSHGWVACCQDCEWLGGDYSRREGSAQEAEMHERGERHPWQAAEVTVWDPSHRPFHGT